MCPDSPRPGGMALGVDVEFLRRVSLFAGLGDPELAGIAPAFSERHYDKGQVIFTEEDTGHYMYVVKEGRVKVSRWLPNGREVILAFHPVADYFGEMSLIDGGTLPALVTAVEATTILSLSRARFNELLREPSFSLALLRTLSARCRDAWQQVEVLTHHQAEARIRMALHQLCKSDGRAEASGVLIDMPLTHRELASMTGVSRETATRILSQLAESKIVVVEEKRFFVADPDQLLDTPLLD